MNTKWSDLSIDLETLDTKPTTVILQIGLQFFDRHTGELGPRQCLDVHILSQLTRTISCRTLRWWAKQDKDAKQSVWGRKHSVPLRRALQMVGASINLHADQHTLRVYGKGSDFDNAALSDAFKQHGMEPPWRFWNNRCLRTTQDDLPAANVEREGIRHNAGDDATHQAKEVIAAHKITPGETRVRHKNRPNDRPALVFNVTWKIDGTCMLRYRRHGLNMFVWSSASDVEICK